MIKAILKAKARRTAKKKAARRAKYMTRMVCDGIVRTIRHTQASCPGITYDMIIAELQRQLAV